MKGVSTVKKDKNRVISLIIVMKTLVEILEGGQFEEETFQVFKDYFVDAGFDIALMDEVPLIAVLQLVCKEFSKLNLEDYWVDGDELITDD